MMTFIDSQTNNSFRLALIRHRNASLTHPVELRHELYNQESMRYETTHRAFYSSDTEVAPVLKAKLQFIKTFLPNFKEVIISA
jgi:hypothetical protein